MLAPGLPLALSRAYDSRNTNRAGCLGKGWTASWDQPGLQLASGLAGNWVEAGMAGAMFGVKCNIAEGASHLATVTLPGGGAAYFAARLTAEAGAIPLDGGASVTLDFPPAARGQGTLRCNGTDKLGGLGVAVVAGSGQNDDWSWSGAPLRLIPSWDDTSGQDFVPSGFDYLAPDGTDYVFAQPADAAHTTW